MKSKILNILAGALLFIIFAAPSISFDAMIPSVINLPEHIKSIAIIDRSERETKLIHVLEGGITGEGIGQDKIASKMCIDGLYKQLKNSGNFEIIRTNIQMKGTDGPTDFMHPLNWNMVKKICKENQVDALISLEYFDTDYVGNEMKAKVGFRIYDPAIKGLTDQYAFNHSVYVDRKNPDFIDLVTSYPDPDAVKNLSYEAGVIYGQRLAPYWIRVTRIYYNRPKRDDNLAFGARMMEVNDWDSAIPALEEAVRSGKRKVQGRAAHNLAVIHEILGDYNIAKEWAQKAWGIYKNKDSKEYTYVLNRRIQEIEVLKAQNL
jgi:hypothetical protein